MPETTSTNITCLYHRHVRARVIGYVYVWDPLVRIIHGAMTLALLAAYFSSQHAPALHRWSGYALAFLVISRLLWGLVGSLSAHPGEYVHTRATIAQHLKDILASRDKRCLGHSPVGGALHILMLTFLCCTVMSGAGLSLSAHPFLSGIHTFLAEGTAALVLLHLAAVLIRSLRHRENLIASILHGRKVVRSDDAFFHDDTLHK